MNFVINHGRNQTRKSSNYNDRISSSSKNSALEPVQEDDKEGELTPKIPFTSYREKVTKRETGYSNTHDEELIDDIGPLPNKNGVSKFADNKSTPNFKIAAEARRAKKGLDMI